MNFVEAIRAAHYEILNTNSDSLILGLGVNYPNGADGTTKGLAQAFPGRVLDTPLSELSITGAAVGMAAQGLRPIVHHGRVEFAMLAFDQIFTQASRWSFMFGGHYSCPVVFRICIGRQWGNGPQHTANYHSIFLQAPGIDIYVPATPEDVYQSLIASSHSERPAVILEHRWLYKTRQEFATQSFNGSAVETASVYGQGEDFTILTYADGLVDSLKALSFSQMVGVHGKIICLKYFSGEQRLPPDLGSSLEGARNLLLVDTAPYQFGLLAGVLSALAIEHDWNIAGAKVVCPPFQPCPTSPSLVGDYYPTAQRIVGALAEFGFPLSEIPPYSFDELHLPPEIDFTSLRIP